MKLHVTLFIVFCTVKFIDGEYFQVEYLNISVFIRSFNDLSLTSPNFIVKCDLLVKKEEMKFLFSAKQWLTIYLSLDAINDRLNNKLT